MPRKSDNRTSDEVLRELISQFQKHIQSIKAAGGTYRNLSPSEEVIEIERLNKIRSEIGKLTKAVQLDLNIKIINGDILYKKSREK